MKREDLVQVTSELPDSSERSPWPRPGGTSAVIARSSDEQRSSAAMDVLRRVMPLGVGWSITVSKNGSVSVGIEGDDGEAHADSCSVRILRALRAALATTNGDREVGPQCDAFNLNQNVSPEFPLKGSFQPGTTSSLDDSSLLSGIQFADEGTVS